jgi:hypothetical protein
LRWQGTKGKAKRKKERKARKTGEEGVKSWEADGETSSILEYLRCWLESLKHAHIILRINDYIEMLR